MIDVPKIRAAAAELPGDTIAITKAQLDQLLDATERGQHARRELISLKRDVGIARTPELRA